MTLRLFEAARSDVVFPLILLPLSGTARGMYPSFGMAGCAPNAIRFHRLAERLT